MSVRVKMRVTGVRDGDVLLGFWDSDGHYLNWGSGYVVGSVGFDQAFWVRYYSQGWLDVCRPGSASQIEVTAGPVVNGTFNVPTGKTVEDWPLKCPRCGTDKSAVMLFSSLDCRRGCFARGTK